MCLSDRDPLYPSHIPGGAVLEIEKNTTFPRPHHSATNSTSNLKSLLKKEKLSNLN